MGIKDFSAALKNRAIHNWFIEDKQQTKDINILANSIKTYREGEQTSSKTSFVITKDTIADVLVELHGMEEGGEMLIEATEIAFNAFKSADVGVKLNRRKITLGPGIDAIYFPTIGFDTITTLVNNILNLNKRQLSSKFEKGHVVGLASELLQATSKRLSKVNTRGTSGKSLILGHLDKVIDYYKRLDLASANQKQIEDIQVYGSVNKGITKQGITRYLVEIQPKDVNQASGAEVKSTIGLIRKLFTPGNHSEATLVKLIENISKKVTDPDFHKDLMDMKTSPSFKTMIADHIASILSSTPIQNVSYKHLNVPIAKQKVIAPNATAFNKEAKKQLANAEALKRKLSSKRSPIRNTSGQFYSLTSLQQLINANLQNVVSANMGDEGYPGGQRKILNYRTGRFAASVKVERLSQSREGAISAFYSFMKYPYQTFQPGFAQGSPKTRDPKLLIAKSIREIAATKVSNRMRAVLI